MTNTLSWFEIFVADLPRAQAFYEQVLGTRLRAETFNGEPNAIFPAEGLKGALVKRASRRPSAEGALVYVDCTGSLDAVLGRVPRAAGRRPGAGAEDGHRRAGVHRRHRGQRGQRRRAPRRAGLSSPVGPCRRRRSPARQGFWKTRAR